MLFVVMYCVVIFYAINYMCLMQLYVFNAIICVAFMLCKVICSAVMVFPVINSAVMFCAVKG